MDKGTVIYWVSRAIRTHENPALRFAQDYALTNHHDLIVVFNLYPDFPYANLRNMDFLLRGLLEMAEKLQRLSIPLMLVEGNPKDNFENLMKEYSLRAIIGEHQVLKPLMLAQDQVRALCVQMDIPFFTLNTSCVVPVEIASPKLEYAARTFRPKIMAKYREYLTETKPLSAHPQSFDDHEIFNEKQYRDILSRYPKWNAVGRSSLIPGEDAGISQLRTFIKDGLPNYALRNEYEAHGQSILSAYLHFGMVSPVQVIREVEASHHENAALFVEEAMVRRELAENFCHYCKDYDNLNGAWPWA
ncbi:MAG: deoxyribodipyrimidine photo-lyase, partial [Erysipelotrichaceae bacterium]